jgi:hypothetical protein
MINLMICGFSIRRWIFLRVSIEDEKKKLKKHMQRTTWTNDKKELTLRQEGINNSPSIDILKMNVSLEQNKNY